MINGDYNMFVNDLYYGEEYNFSYKDREYFIHSKIIVFYPKSFFNIQNYSANKGTYKNINKRMFIHK